MDERISRQQMLMEMVQIVARRTDCQRQPDGVGALIARDARVITTGYAAAPSGSPACGQAGSTCDPALPCTRTVHAEANAIAFAARHGIAVEGCSMYCTLAPCTECAKLIINAGIIEVIYLRNYRSEFGIRKLKDHGITVKQWTP